MNEILTIVKATYAGDYQIVAEFSNGETRLLDFSEIVASGKGMCKLLKNKEYFQHFNEIGFEPEFLYAMSKPLPKYKPRNMGCDLVAEEHLRSV